MVVDRPEVAAWKAAYRELDSGALLSILPALDAAIAAAKTELETLGRALHVREKSHGFVAEHVQNAMLRESGVDVSKYVTGPEGFADLTSERASRHEAMVAYLTDLILRRQWILDVETCRRRLLPDPADFPYSDVSSS